MQNKLVNTENIFKLVTKEDPNYIHKVLGCICMTNFLYQYYHVFFYGTTNLDNILGMYLITLHGILSISSLIFHIPSIRNRSSPMIYPEFRIHSIIFALRAVFCCYLTYFKFHFIYKIATCYITMICADITTSKYNNMSNQENTLGKKTNTTMRNMPFDKSVPIELQNRITRFDSGMQVAATIYMLGNIETEFFTLCPIQLSAFLMTLVRKNIISTTLWHRIYTSLLISNIFCYFSLSTAFILTKIVAYKIFINLRFKYKINKYYAWSIVFTIFYFLYNYLVTINMNDFLVINETYIIKGIMIFFIFKNYKNIL